MYFKIKIEQKSIAQSTERIGFFVISMRSADANRLTVSFTGRDFSGNAGGNPDKKYHPLLGSPDLNFKAREIEAQTTTSDKVLIDQYMRSVMFEKGMRGFELSRDEYGKWLLEIDRIVARVSITATELVRNRVTVANNQTWFTDNGIIEAVHTVDGYPKQLLITIAKDKGGASTFQLDDLLKGVYLDSDGNSFNFQTVCLTVIETITPYILLVELYADSPPPRTELILVRTGNRTNPERQNSIFIDGARPAMFYYVSVDSHEIGMRNIAHATGNLRGMNFGRLTENKPIEERFSNVIRGHNYQAGRFFAISDDGLEYPVLVDRGVWSSALKYFHYEMVSHQGAIYTCAVEVTTKEPSDDNTDWTRRVEKGEDALAVSILSSNGNNFIGGNVSTTLVAVVHKGLREITDILPQNAYNWRRVSDNPEGDNVWNELHKATGSRIEIDGNDVYRRATFECLIRID